MNEQSPAEQAKHFDIFEFEDVTEGEVRIKHPDTGAPTPVVIRIASPEHPARKAIEHARQRRARKLFAQTNRVPVDEPSEDVERENEMLVAATLGWSGLMAGGSPLEYSPAAAAKLYADPKRGWLREQVLAAMSARDNFIRRSAAR